MSTNVEGEKPKVITTRRSSLKCRQLVNKLDPDAIMKAKPKGKRNSVSWKIGSNLKFPEVMTKFDIENKKNDKQV